MYISASRSADTASAIVEGASERPRTRIWRRVAPNVIALGTVSLITDISSEMVTAVLPLYVVLQLGLSPLAFGFLDGLYSGVSAAVRLVAAQAADRWQRRKLVAGLGYSLSAICKPGLLLVGHSVPGLGAVLAVDRTGKGLRTAPRDALISLSSPPDDLGRAFGVHRAMDTAGALIGPLVAFGLLWASAGTYDAVFMVSFCIATFAVLVLALFVRDHRPLVPPSREATAGRKVSVRATFALLRARPFRRVCICAAMLGLVTVSDAFIYLLLQHRLGIAAQYFPLLPLGTAAVYLLLAVPFGVVADRTGRWVIFLGGHVALLGAYLVLLGPVAGIPLLAGTLALHGVFYATTDGVLMAVAGPMLPEHLRTSGMALVQTGQAAMRLISSVLFGGAWTLWGQHGAMVAAAVALGGMVGLALFLIPVPIRGRRAGVEVRA